MILFIRDALALFGRKVSRQRGIVIVREVEPPTRERGPQHYVILRHRFDDIQLETRLDVSKRRWKRTTLGKPMRFGFETDFPHTAYVSYWRYALAKLGKRFLLLLLGGAVAAGCAYYVFWRNGAGI